MMVETQKPHPASIPACTVLVVDDCAEDRAIYQDYLGRHPAYLYTFLEAENVEAGLRVCRSVHVDCILLDFGLPDGTGLEFLARLAQEAGTGRPAVVMITGRGNERTAVECLQHGAADYLPKADVQPEGLFRAVHHAVERGRIEARLEEQRGEREQAEAELRDSEARLAMLVDSVRDYAIFMLDPDGHVASWNAGARDLLGLHDVEIIGQHVRQIFVPEAVADRLPEDLLAAARARDTAGARDEGFMVGRGGRKIWMMRQFSPVVDRQGALRGYSAVLRDVSERRDAEVRFADAARARGSYLCAATARLQAPLAAATAHLDHAALAMEDGKAAAPPALRAAVRGARDELTALAAAVAGLAPDGNPAAARAPEMPPPAAEAAHGRRDRP